MKRLINWNARLESLVTEIAEGTARLLHVVEAHEQRISDLEGHHCANGARGQTEMYHS
jgi:hypothetical protein